jgi:hypothetical protein
MQVTGVLILLASAGGHAAATPAATGVLVSPAGATDSAKQPEPARGCPPPVSGPAAVDYVDFLQANGRNYIADFGVGLRVSPPDLGTVVLRVRCSYAAVNNATGMVSGPPRDGDAAFLTPGTKVYNLRGWSPLCRLAAVHDQAWHVYLAYQPDTEVATPEPCALHRGS